MKLNKTIFNYILALALFLVAGCETSKSDLEDFQKKFREEKLKFETLVKLLDRQNLDEDYAIDETKLSPDIRHLLKDLHISDVSRSSTGYDFECSWSRKLHLYFSKEKIDSDKTYNGYHARKSETIEVWGLGDGWLMWVDYDFI